MLNINKNNLSSEKSLYLQQHKNNPVNWQTWSEEIFQISKEKKIPIILSIGYASCHWCHVMAHESFEDGTTAKYMNKNFINIKVDREERPDIDFVFQSSFQLFNQSSGGWPLTAFLDENGIPFSVGTYFPKKKVGALPTFLEVLEKVKTVYDLQRDKIISQSKLIKNGLTLKKNSVLNQSLEPILETSMANLDKLNGGFIGAPKFPHFIFFETLLYFYNKTEKEIYIQPVEKLLNSLCSEGIYDHVEGGVSRYTIDEKWLVPHFEKMFYDNVQFVSLISKFCKVKKNKYFEKKLTETINFLMKNFICKNSGLMGSAYDADSDGKEGEYYTFYYDEIKSIKNIEKYFEINPNGNWEGKIILREIGECDEFTKEKLRGIRQGKIKPSFDNKAQSDLNSMWISALIEANKILPNNGYLAMAQDLYNKMFKKYDNGLFHCFDKKIVFLENYAFYIKANLDLYDATFNIEYKNEAIKNIKTCDVDFYNETYKIYQKNLKSKKDIFIEPIDISDHTIPNGNSIMLSNHCRVGGSNIATELSRSLHGYLNIYKNYMTSAIKALDYYEAKKTKLNCDENGCKI